MAIIITNTNWLQIDGARLQKGKWDLSRISTGVRLSDAGERIDIPYQGTTIDGASVVSADELFDFFDSQGFKQGGTDPGEVTGVQSVTGNIVSGTAENPVVNMPIDISNHPARTDNPHNVTSDQVGLGNVDNTSDINKPISSATLAALADKQSLSEKGQAGGYPELGLDGLIPIEYLNVSGLTFLGAWDASTNTPELLNGVGNVGDFYKVSVGGTHDFGVQPYTFVVGDWVIYAAGVWQRLGSSDAVSMVNGKVGNVVVNKTDVGLPNVDNTSDANKPLSIADVEALAGKSDIEHTHVIADVVGLQDALGQVPATEVSSFSVTSTGNVFTINIPEDAPDLLRIEMFIPSTAVRAWVSMRLNGVSSSVYRNTIHNVNSVDYTLLRFSSGSEIRLISATSSSPAIAHTSNLVIRGVISNKAGQMKAYTGSGSANGSSATTNPDISNCWGTCHDAGVTSGKITQIQFRTNISGSSFAIGTTVRVYGIK